MANFCISGSVDRAICRIVVIFWLLSPLPSAAQEPVTLDRAVQTALSHNASLRASQAGVDEAAALAASARSGWFPRISVTESWQRGDQPVFVFSSLLSARRFAATNFAIDALNHPDPVGFFRTSVAVEQLLFDGGRQHAAATTAALRRTLAEAARTEAGAAIVVDTTAAFGRLLISEAARRAADAGLTATREDLARAERRREGGLATEADVLALAVHVAELQQRGIQAQGAAAAARAQLNRLMGAAIDAPLQVVEPAAPSVGELIDQRDVTALLAQADAARPELKRAAAEEQIAAAARRHTRAALIPQIAAQALFESSGTRFTDRASSWVVGGELRWTFSIGGAELAALKAAAASLARTRAVADDVRAAVHVDVVTALSGVESARARYAVSAAAVAQARESQRIIRDRFEAGVAPVNDVLRASTTLLDADANRVTALIDIIVSAAMLQRALGRTP